MAICVRSPHSAMKTTTNAVHAAFAKVAFPSPSASFVSCLRSHIATAEARKTTPATTWTTRPGRSETSWPAATATRLWMVSAAQVPSSTGHGLWRVARTSAASAVLSGNSATKTRP